MQYNGLGNIIIDVVASGRAGKIIKTDSTSGDFNEVILRNKPSGGKKVLVGLYRGGCGGKAKKGFANFSLFGSNKQECTPGNTMYQQIAFFPETYHDELYRGKGILATGVSKFFSQYTVVNPLKYIFYYGLVNTDGGVTTIHGDGRMFRKIHYGGYETIQGVWGGGLEVTDSNYNPDLVSNAIACRIPKSTNYGNEAIPIDGIATGGIWNKGNYYGGECLSWRVDFGRDVVFNYTGRFPPNSNRPVEGVCTFNKINNIPHDTSKYDPDWEFSVIDPQKIESLFVRTFTLPITNEKNEKKDIGICVKFISNPNIEISSIYIGEFDENTFVENGYGIEFKFNEAVQEMYLGSFDPADANKYGTLYKITSASPTPSETPIQQNYNVNGEKIEMVQQGRFSKGVVDSDPNVKKIAEHNSMKAINNFKNIYSKYNQIIISVMSLPANMTAKVTDLPIQVGIKRQYDTLSQYNQHINYKLGRIIKILNI